MDNNDEKKYDKMCFVIMPIGELDSYPTDHFKHVYEDIFSPAIEKAGYKAKRADDDKSSSVIQLEIIRDIVNAPMALCDLSTRNPNVLFELGIRQAFDLPVVLVQERGTPRIFDISSINTIDYDKSMFYRTVNKDVENIKEAIIATRDTEKGINSIVKLLEITKASISPNNEMTTDVETKFMLRSILNEVRKIKTDTEKSATMTDVPSIFEMGYSRKELPRLIRQLEEEYSVLCASEVVSVKEAFNLLHKIEILLKEAEAGEIITASEKSTLRKLKKGLNEKIISFSVSG